jgi:MFS family permease
LLTTHWTPRADHAGSKRQPSLHQAVNIRMMLAEFRRTLREHRTFRLGVLAQFLFMLGSYPAQRFLLLFLRDRFGDNAEQKASVGVAVAIVLATLGAAVAGALSDAIGRKAVLIGSVAIGGVGLAAIGFSPSISWVALAGGLIAIGLGAFQSVNWALMNDDLPAGQAASSLGVANIATAGAGAAAGLFGPLVDGMNALFPQGTYQTLFGVAGLVALLSLLPLRRLEEREGR